MFASRLAAAVIAAACLLTAQEYRGRIQGIVTDTSQAAIPAATVTLVNVNTGVRNSKQTNETGAYIFDFVEPGAYQLSVEFEGFKKFLQENIRLESRGDVTVNAVLNPGAVTDSVTVVDTPVAVNFSTANVQTIVDTKLANDIPRFDRNPFKLSLLSPSAINTRTEMNPYNSWAANSVELGGGTNLKNDITVDGSPVGIGHKASYTPPPDAVQEVAIQQNSVDAETGHSAGGSIGVTMKSGTNEWHGNVWFLGRNPALNAVTDRTLGTVSAARNNMFGGSLGNPIIKNKLFNYAVFEVWKQTNPINYLRTLPTELERQGDFSQSRNINGGIRTIYDPFSTRLDPATGAVTRDPFPGNKIPADRIDPVAAKLMQLLWKPNSAGDNITGINNFRTVLRNKTDYWNFSDRADYSINDRWKTSGRFSRLHTLTTSNDPTENASPLYIVQNPSARHATSVNGDAVWTASAATVVNFRGEYHSLVDDFSSPRDMLQPGALANIWNNDWYSAFQRPDDLPSYIPGVTIGGSAFGMGGTYWYQHPNGYSFSGKMAQARGAHYWKSGVEYRHSGGVSLVTGNTLFSFPAALTANTFNAPDTRVVGHEYATFLLGAVDSGSRAIVKPVKEPRSNFWGFFVQDDWRITRNLTINLGLRYEVDTPWYDPQNRISRGMDLTAVNEAIQSNPPQVPAAVQQYLKTPWNFNGQWSFTDENNKYAWNRQWNNFMPRAGFALRVGDATSIRFGYARYSTPTEYNFIDAPFTGFEAVNYLEPPYLGYDATQAVQGLLVGVPQATLSNPFPANRNPLIPPRGRDFGPYYGTGGQQVMWFYQDQRRPTNDRLSLSIQRQLPGQIVVDATGFLNFGHNVFSTRNLNMADPNLSYTHKTALQATVPNPFYQYLTPSQFPGPTRNQATVSIGSLLNPYPQYAGLFEIGRPGFRERYQSVQLQARRPFANGFNFLFGYAYIRERIDAYFNDVENYFDRPAFQESAQPRHRISTAGTYQLPFGRGRQLLNGANRWVDGVLGGWQIVGALYYNSGAFLRFGGLDVSGNPVIENPTPDRWFDTSVFKVQTPFTPRMNPWQYSGLTGPSTMEVQASVSKEFAVTERWRTELRANAFNATNRLNRADPDLGVTSSNFGKTLRQRGNYFGRQLEIGLKIMF